MIPKKIASSKYKGVCKVKSRDDLVWMMRFVHNGIACIKRYDTERGAGIAYDRKMIELGKEPVNVLIKK